MVVPLYDGGIVVGRRVRTTSTSKQHLKNWMWNSLWVETGNENQTNFEEHQFSNNANKMTIQVTTECEYMVRPNNINSGFPTTAGIQKLIY